MPQVPSSLLDPTLLQELCTTVLQPQVADFLPFGILARAKAYLALPDPPAEPQWQSIDSAPLDVNVLLFCPFVGWTNEARVELGFAGSARGGWLHRWATHWMQLPKGPKS